MKVITGEKIRHFELYLTDEEKSRNTVEKYVCDGAFFKEWLCVAER